MAIFDPALQRICVRIVYDGPAGTGKTTNVAALSTLFASAHSTEVYSPGEASGRTLYFDWVQLMAGVVCGFPLMCQVISVPGQTVLTPRRRHLLAMADAVVLVCDSSEAGVDRAKKGRALVERLGDAARPVPLIVQANKQDQRRALTGPQVAARLGCERDAVVEAIATQGIGVIDTFVSAVRAVSAALQAASAAGSAGAANELRLVVGRVTEKEDLLTRLEAEAIAPEWAAEMFLEEAQASLLIAGDGEPDLDASRAPRGDARVGNGRANGRGAAPPTTPRRDVETGFIWPAATGRATLGELALPDEGAFDGAGAWTIEASGYVLRTSRDHRFEDREAARQALVRAARERTQLDTLLVPGTVLALQPARDGALWLWTLHPVVTTLVEAQAAAADSEASSALLRAYAAAVAEGARVMRDHGFALVLEPSAFGCVDGVVRYVGEVGLAIDGGIDGESAADLARQLALAVGCAAPLGWDAAELRAALDRELRARGVAARDDDQNSDPSSRPDLAPMGVRSTGGSTVTPTRTPEFERA